jgi:hypothetical protein
MIRPPPRFTVDRVRRPLGDGVYPGSGYASKPGDARRSGRVDDARGMAAVRIAFVDRGSHIEARLGVVTVGMVTHDPAAGGFFWAVHLAGMSAAPKPAGDADKAKSAIEHKVREWCEAAKLISARGK